MGTFQKGIRVVFITLTTMGAIAGIVFLAGCSDDSGSAAKSSPEKSPAVPMPSTKAATTSSPAPAEPVADTRTQAQLVEAGRAVYLANCIACHNMNPAQDGALGPAVAGASLELLTARVVQGNYPEGYTPKRPSRVMIPLPHLEAQLPELAVYLESAE